MVERCRSERAALLNLSDELSADLLAVLVCPETRQRLRASSSDELARAKLAHGLTREDGRVVYPIVEGIPMLLVEHGVRIDV